MSAKNVGGSTPSQVLSSVTLNGLTELDPISDVIMRFNSLYELQLFATDSDGDDLTITAAYIPDFSTFTDYGDGSALLSFSPLEADQGVYPNIAITVSDGFG